MSSLKLIPLKMSKDMKHVFGPQLTLSMVNKIDNVLEVEQRSKTRCKMSRNRRQSSG